MSARSGSEGAGQGARRVRKRRMQLSCGECRSKKLSCDRNWPCRRCVRSGRQDECSYETPTGRPPVPNQQAHHQSKARSDDSEYVRRLQTEIAELKKLVIERSHVQSHVPVEPDERVAPHPPTLMPPTAASTPVLPLPNVNNTAGTPDHPKDRTPRGYCAQHCLFKFFVEIPELFPFITETSEEWLKPAGVHLKKTEPRTQANASTQLDSLLPPKEVADVLVAFYLDHSEHLHRVVHVPTFKKQYENFWLPRHSRSPAVAALILSIMAISVCACPVGAEYQNMAACWIAACDEWVAQQSLKCHKLIQYQVLCLSYLAKRMNMIHKKRFWIETGNLVQRAMMDDLHCDEPSSTTDSVFMIEMKRRIWHVIRELELQNSYEHGLPTLLHNIESNVTAPANLDDGDSDNAWVELPPSSPPQHYTRTSFQSTSAHSWPLRLEISRRLCSPAVSQPLTYDDVLRYTQNLTQAIGKLPSWDLSSNRGLPTVANAVLQFQLKECILAIHRPYLKKDSSKFWISENICHHMSRDMLLLNCQMADWGFQSLTRFREDLLLASLTLTRIITLQQLSSTSVIMSCAESVVQLMQRCLPIMEDRCLNCANSEPWCFLTMCATFLLLKVHLGKEYRPTAKYSCAQRFLELRNKHFAKQQTAPTMQQQPQQLLQQPTPQDSVLRAGEPATCPGFPPQDISVTLETNWSDNNLFDFTMDPFDSHVDLDRMWQGM